MGLKGGGWAMATLTTVEGIQYNFDPSTVVAVSDHDPATKQAVTCVYGVTGNYLKVKENIQEFLSRLNITANFAPLTAPNGGAVWLNGSSIAAIRGRVAGDARGANAVVYTSSITQWLKDSVADAVTALDAHGGKL
jgi:hypothetical protein